MIKDDKIKNPNFNKERFGKFFDEEGVLIPEMEKEYLDEIRKEREEKKNLKEADESNKIKGIKRKEKIMKEDLDNASEYANINEARIGKTKEVKVLQGNYGYGWDDLVEYEIDDFNGDLLAMNKEIRQDLKDYRENETNASHRVITRRVARELKEDLERQFTIFYNRDDFKYGIYGAVRVKATDEDAAREKFFDKKVKEDPHLYIFDIRPTEDSDIKEGIRLMEAYENPIKIDEVEEKARLAVNPSYAQALRDRKKFNKITDKKVSADLDNVLNKDFKLDKVKKLELQESLFEDWDEIDDSRERELSADDYLDDVRRGHGWVEVDKIQMDIENGSYHCNVQDVLNRAAEKGWKFDYRPEGLVIYAMKSSVNENKDIKKIPRKIGDKR